MRAYPQPLPEGRGEAKGERQEERNAPQHEVHFLLYEVDIKD